MSADPHDLFPAGFFSRVDESPDDGFYQDDRFVTRIDDRAIESVGRLYRHLGIGGPERPRVLDVMSSWISHFLDDPAELVALGMNRRELQGNRQATSYVVHDLNSDPVLPFHDDRFDAAICCVSVDYLVRPIDVVRELARVLRPGGTSVFTFSNRCFPTKVIRGWMAISEDQRCDLVARYLELAGGFAPSSAALLTPPNSPGDPLYAVWADTVG